MEIQSINHRRAPLQLAYESPFPSSKSCAESILITPCGSSDATFHFQAALQRRQPNFIGRKRIDSHAKTFTLKLSSHLALDCLDKGTTFFPNGRAYLCVLVSNTIPVICVQTLLVANGLHLKLIAKPSTSVQHLQPFLHELAEDLEV